MGNIYNHSKNGGNNYLKMIFDPYKESSYIGSDSIEPLESCGIIPNCIIGYNGAIYDSQTHNIYIYKISAITMALKYNGIYKFPTDDINADRCAAAFYDKHVFNHLTSVRNKEYKSTDGNKISYFVHSFGYITNLQAANNAFDWLVVPRELFNSDIDNDFIYLFVCIKNKFNPSILNYIIPTNTPFYWDYPVANSLYDKQSLSESDILLGSVKTLSPETNKFAVLEGSFLWHNPKEILYSKSELCTIYKRSVNFIDKNGVVYDNFPLDVYVYSNENKHSVKVFVWRSGNEDDAVKKSYIQDYLGINGSEKYISDKYNYILDSLSLNTIFDKYVAFTKLSYDVIARYITRNLACKPKGYRSISIEGNFERLMGGVLYKISEILTDAKDKSELSPEEYSQIKFLFSINNSVLWYDSPVKYDIRNILNIPQKLGYNSNIDTEHKIKSDIIFYLKNVLGIENGSNGCERVSTIISGIFEKLQYYNIEIDYVFCDIEKIFNDARMLIVRRLDKRLENAIKNEFITSLDASSKVPNVRNLLYNNIIYKEVQKRENIWNELNQRGYFFDNAKFNDICNVQDNEQFYGISYKTYEHRRNVNVWDTVMKNYENSLFYDFIFAPILSFPKYSKTKCSSNSRFDAKGYINQADRFETYLGGSIKIHNDLYSCIPIYEDYVSEGYKKLSMDNWKLLPDTLDNIFQYFIGHINRIKRTELSSNGKFSVFFSSWNIWAFELNKRLKFIQNSKIVKPNLEQESKIYYKELLFHMFLSCPDKAIAYFNIEKRRDKNILDYIDLFENGKYNSIEELEYIRHYYTDSYENLSSILREFNQITNNENLTSLCRCLAIEPYPFVISGVTAKFEGGKEMNIWRITCDSKHGFDIINSDNPIICINGKTISFSQGEITTDKASNNKIGLWVTTPNNVFPVITSDRNYYNYNPVYHYIKNINEKTSDIALFDKYRRYTLFGELPKNHAVSLKFKIKHFNNHFARLLYSGTLKPLEVIIGYDENTKDKQIKGVPLYFKGIGKDTNVIGLNETTIYQLNLLLKLNKINTANFKLSVDYELIDTNNDNSVLLKEHTDDISYTPKIENIQYLMATLGIISPEDSLKGSEKESFLNCFDVKEFKIYHTGFNYKTEIFRNYNGINFSRVNKHVPTYNDMPVESIVGDTFTAKISWLNATNNGIDCKLIFKVNSIQHNIDKNCIVYPNDSSIIFSNDFDLNQELVISSNSEGYILINLPFKASINDKFSLSLQYNHRIE